MNEPKVTVVGLGRLGLPLAALLADSGCWVTGVDNDPAVAHDVGLYTAHFYEPGLQDLLDGLLLGRLQATTSVASAVYAADIAIVLVPTPSFDNGNFSNRHVLDVCKGIGEALQEQDGFFTVIISSTVMPGSCDGPIKEMLEETSRKQCGGDFGLCYVPEFVRLGSVIQDMKTPDFVMIGASDPKSARITDGLFARLRDVTWDKYAVRRTSLINAEIAKLYFNAYMVTKIALANEIGEMCEQYAGADVDAVTGIVQFDRRIGVSFRAATHAAGPCFARDCRALDAAFASSASLVHAVDVSNYGYAQRLCARVLWEAASFDDPSVAILGLAYKTDTPVTEGSFAMMLIDYLGSDVRVAAYDPLVDIVQSEACAEDAILNADVVVLTLPYMDFAFLAFRPGQTVIDCWRLIDDFRAERMREAGVKVVQLGRNRDG
jgi:UDPglucose 6-dehydrogenase